MSLNPFLRVLQTTILASLMAAALGLVPERVFAETDAGPDFDFSAIDFASHDRGSLRGKWWFKFDELMSPLQAYAAHGSKTMDTVNVPHDWREAVTSDDRNVYAHGMATYVAELILPSDRTLDIGVAFPRIADAYKVYWVPLDAPHTYAMIGGDGAMSGPIVASHGTRGYTIRGGEHGLLVVHVRKELQSYGGIVRAPFVMDGGAYQDELQMKRVLEGIVMGVTLFVAMLNLFLYLVYRKDPATLILAIASLAMLLRSFTLAGSFEIIFGAEIRDLRIRLEYAGILFLAWASFAMHQTLLWRRFGDLRGPLLLGLVAMLGGSFLFAAPLPVVTDNLIYVQLFCVFTFCMIVVTSVRAIATRQPDAWFYTVGWTIPLVAGLHDIYSSITYNGVYLVNYAFVLFMCIYSLKVGRRVTTAITRNEFLEKERKTLQKLHQDAVDTARHDHLTGLLNRQAFDDEFSLAWHEKDASDQGLSLILMDIDHFKSVNDNYGHPAGDEILRSVASLLQSSHLRKADRVCRYGGEEFVILLPDTNSENAVAVAERLRQRIEMHATDCPGNVSLTVTASFGIACAKPDAAFEPTVLLQQADDALYHAKDFGRNRVVQHAEIAQELDGADVVPFPKSA